MPSHPTCIFNFKYVFIAFSAPNLTLKYTFKFKTCFGPNYIIVLNVTLHCIFSSLEEKKTLDSKGQSL